MKASTKIALIIASVLVILGIGIFVLAIAIGGTDGTSAGMKPVKHTVNAAFSGVQVEASSADINIRTSPDGSCYSVCSENSSITYSVTVEDDTLTITEHDSRRWYEKIGIAFSRREVNVFLPAGSYGSLRLKVSSGDIEAEGSLTFAGAEYRASSGDIESSVGISGTLYVNTASGDVSVTGAAVTTAEISVVSGDISLSDITAAALTAETTSGEIELHRVKSDSCRIETTSGDVDMTSVVTTGLLSADVSSGNIRFSSCDGGEIRLHTSSGNIRGSLLTPKVFEAASSSGRVNVPASVAGAGLCRATTSSGNINITVG